MPNTVTICINVDIYMMCYFSEFNYLRFYQNTARMTVRYLSNHVSFKKMLGNGLKNNMKFVTNIFITWNLQTTISVPIVFKQLYVQLIIVRPFIVYLKLIGFGSNFSTPGYDHYLHLIDSVVLIQHILNQFQKLAFRKETSVRDIIHEQSRFPLSSVKDSGTFIKLLNQDDMRIGGLIRWFSNLCTA